MDSPLCNAGSYHTNEMENKSLEYGSPVSKDIKKMTKRTSSQRRPRSFNSFDKMLITRFLCGFKLAFNNDKYEKAQPRGLILFFIVKKPYSSFLNTRIASKTKIKKRLVSESRRAALKTYSQFVSFLLRM